MNACGAHLIGAVVPPTSFMDVLRMLHEQSDELISKNIHKFDIDDVLYSLICVNLIKQ